MSNPGDDTLTGETTEHFLYIPGDRLWADEFSHVDEEYWDRMRVAFGFAGPREEEMSSPDTKRIGPEQHSTLLGMYLEIVAYITEHEPQFPASDSSRRILGSDITSPLGEKMRVVITRIKPGDEQEVV